MRNILPTYGLLRSHLEDGFDLRGFARPGATLLSGLGESLEELEVLEIERELILKQFQRIRLQCVQLCRGGSMLGPQCVVAPPDQAQVGNALNLGLAHLNLASPNVSNFIGKFLAQCSNMKSSRNCYWKCRTMT